ncbi:MULTISPECIES: NVEALA domain-containing protein [unclassified Butyricimonas]|uniref:NVEALA domain-containing protein n=1 Tax=unclassified Butyricimonas TaxID=2637652 RepID=UPI000C07B15C|nr:MULTISPECIES: NVEALA domain-containing protein [unclassified Butyricimonas]
MKKKTLNILFIFIIAIITSISININLSKKESFGNLALKNIEALARGEGGSGSESGKATCYTRASVNVNDEYLRCVECKYYSGTGVTTGGYCKW